MRGCVYYCGGFRYLVGRSSKRERGKQYIYIYKYISYAVDPVRGGWEFFFWEGGEWFYMVGGRGGDQSVCGKYLYISLMREDKI